MRTTMPRVPHLPGSRLGQDDLVAGVRLVRALLEEPVVVLEKLDGVALTIATEGGQLDVAMKEDWRRALGGRVLRAARLWVRIHEDRLRPLVAGGAQLYAEWLLHELETSYDRLPAAVVFHSLRDPKGRLLGRDQANPVFAAHGLAFVEPHFRGVIGRRPLASLVPRRTQFGRGCAEGIIVELARRGRVRWAKWVAAHYRQPTGADLSGRENRVVEDPPRR